MKKINLIIIFFSLFIFLPLITNAATLSITPRDGTYSKGQNFNVDVLINSNTSVNAFSSIISFPTDTLEVISTSRSNSIIDLWTQNPSFSNSGSIGNIRFEGVVLSPGFIGSGGKLLTLTFRVKNEGSANLTFSSYNVLENDGFGTKAVTTVQGARFVFSPSKPATPESKTLPTVRDIIVVKEIEANKAVLDAWNFLPDWIKISVLSLIGITALFLLLLIMSFGVVILIWLWGHLREREDNITRWLKVLRKLVKNFFKAIPVFLGLVEKEIQGDVKYSISQLQEDVREAKNHTPLSKVLGDFWASLGRIIKRFFTKNEKTTKDKL